MHQNRWGVLEANQASLHADGTVYFYIPARSVYLCIVFVYRFEFLRFKEDKAKALANTSQYVVAPPLPPSVS